MRKYLLSILLIGIVAIFYLIPSLNRGSCPFGPAPEAKKLERIKKGDQPIAIKEALRLLKIRKDNQALAIFKGVLVDEPNNLDALWGEAEVLRRSRDYKASESILNEILKKSPGHAPSLISLAYIAYKDDKLQEALELIDQVFANDHQDKNNQALAYMLMGVINSRRSAKSRFFNKIKYGIQIKRHFLKAASLAPDLPEVHLGLGTFYLLAPAIMGRDLDRAIEELELAVKIAPGFATANARLAQGYKNKGMQDKYTFYISLAKSLDPENEVLWELE